MSGLNPSGPTPGPRTITRTLAAVFSLLFLQMLVLLLVALATGKPPVFVEKYPFAFDFNDFFQAAQDWSRHLNPYLRSRFVTPPPSLLAALVFRHLAFATAARLFFGLNLLLVLGSVWLISRHFGLDRAQRLLMLGIAALYYPTVFLLHRGNLDGLMLALITIFLLARSTWLRSLSLAASIVLKLYSALLLAPVLLTRHFRIALLTLLLIALLLLPFHALLAPFTHTLLTRSGKLTAVENLSPAVLLGSAAKHAWGKLIFFAFWAGTLLAALRRHRSLPVAQQSLLCLPWMAAFPLQVYPYTGVLLLPVLAWQVANHTAKPRTLQQLFLAGFLLVGIQQQALDHDFRWLVHSHRFFPMLNVLGMTAILLALAFSQPPSSAKNSLLDRDAFEGRFI